MTPDGDMDDFMNNGGTVNFADGAYYGSFGDASFPLAHIINAYLNPFSNNVETFQLSVVALAPL